MTSIADTSQSPSQLGSASNTPRFTNEEKALLYSLFQENEEVIDIKYRKKSKNKISIQEAWKKIVDEYNSHPSIATPRNKKQIQKFWLNARLRKQYPSGVQHGQTTIKPVKKSSNQCTEAKNNTPAVKVEPEVTVLTTPDEHLTDGVSEYGEYIVPTSSPHVIETSQQNTTTVQIQQPQQQQQQHISVDQISADKLTLNDLLQFKGTRPREEIILQIKSPDAQTILTTQPHHRIQFQPLHQAPISSPSFKHHQIIAESPIQQHTTQIQTSPQYCTVGHIQNTTSTNIPINSESFEDKVNFFKLKEAEIKYKEEQLRLEQKKIELARSQEELKHVKELNRLQIEEMRIKIRILHEEEKKMKK